MNAGYRSLATPGDNIVWELNPGTDEKRFTVTVTCPAPEPPVIFSFSKGSIFPWLPSQMSIPFRMGLWTYEYNSDGLCTQEDHPDGYQILRQYDTDSADIRTRQNCIDESVVALSKKPEGYLKTKGQSSEFLPGTNYPTKVTAYQIDITGVRRLLMETRYEYRNDSLDLWKSSVGGEPTWYFWNQRGQMLAEVNGCGNLALYYYMPGLPVKDMETFVDGTPDGGGGLVRIVEDAPVDALAPLVISEDRHRIGQLPKRSSVVPPTSEVTRFLYDRLGRKTGHDGPGNQMFASVNRLGQPLTNWDSSAGMTVTEYDVKLLRQRVYHQFTPQTPPITDMDYTGTPIKPFECRFYIESYEYDTWDRVTAFVPSDQPVQGHNDKPTFRYER